MTPLSTGIGTTTFRRRAPKPDGSRVFLWVRLSAHDESVIDLGVDSSTPTGELVANVMISVAQWERRVIGEKTSAAIQAAKRAGRHMGRVSALPRATGDRLMMLRSTHTLAGAATQLNAEGLATATGGPWSPNNVGKAQKRLIQN